MPYSRGVLIYKFLFLALVVFAAIYDAGEGLTAGLKAPLPGPSAPFRASHQAKE